MRKLGRLRSEYPAARALSAASPVLTYSWMKVFCLCVVCGCFISELSAYWFSNASMVFAAPESSGTIIFFSFIANKNIGGIISYVSMLVMKPNPGDSQEAQKMLKKCVPSGKNTGS